MKPAHKKLGLIFALAIGSSSAANGAVLYDNLSVDPFGGFKITSTGYMAAQFSTEAACPSGCVMGNVTMTIKSLLNDRLTNPDTDGYQVRIFNNASGMDALANSIDVPGSAIGSMINPSSFSKDFSNHVFTPNGTIDLANNSKYWVYLSPTANFQTGEEIQWKTSSVFDAPGHSIQVGLDPTQLSWVSNPDILGETFRMKVEAVPSSGANPIPIPGAVWLMGSALLGLVTVRRRQAG
jgi:hypothetical protein